MRWVREHVDAWGDRDKALRWEQVWGRRGTTSGQRREQRVGGGRGEEQG